METESAKTIFADVFMSLDKRKLNRSWRLLHSTVYFNETFAYTFSVKLSTCCCIHEPQILLFLLLSLSVYFMSPILIRPIICIASVAARLFTQVRVKYLAATQAILRTN